MNVVHDSALIDAIAATRIPLLQAEALIDAAGLDKERDEIDDVRICLAAATASDDIRVRVAPQIDRLRQLALRCRNIGLPDEADLLDIARHAIANACDACLSDTQPIDLEDP